MQRKGNILPNKCVFKTIFLFIQHIAKWISNLYIIYIYIYIYIIYIIDIYIHIYIYIYIYIKYMKTRYMSISSDEI